jgi:hypothetical protein
MVANISTWGYIRKRARMEAEKLGLNREDLKQVAIRLRKLRKKER